MDGSKSTSEIFKDLGIGGEPDICPSDREAAAFDQSAFEANYRKTEESGDENETSSDQKPPVVAHETQLNPSASQDKPPDLTPMVDSHDDLQAVQKGVERIGQDVKTLAEASEKTVGEVREMHKLYHNEFANRLKSMQDELEQYREIEKGRMFDSILGEVAKLYSDNESVVEEIADDKLKKRIRYMFLDILQLLEANGVSKLKSNAGERRNTRHCQVIERISTNDPALHDTVSKSRSSGFYVENRSLVKELVDVYIFADRIADKSAES